MTAIIVGGGIGGLTTALALHSVGLECRVFEQVPDPKELGVGLNLLPSAVEILTDLGLLGELDQHAIRTRRLTFATRRGDVIARVPRGLDAGAGAPQFSIHRGKLLRILLDAVRDRLGNRHLVTGCRLEGLEQRHGEVIARFKDQIAGCVVEQAGSCLIGADGIHSTTRALLNPGEAPPSWSGYMLWRGATDWPAWTDGQTMLIAGGMTAKFVFYPIFKDDARPDRRLTNWAVWIRAAETTATHRKDRRRDSWTKQGKRPELDAIVREKFDLELVDIAGIIRRTDEILEFPLLDREPLACWTQGRVTLLGDAAHPMYPAGSNGATQAIIDAATLSDCLARQRGVESAFRAYEEERRPATEALIVANRSGGPERIIDLVEERAPDGFSSLGDILSPAELRQYGILPQLADVDD